MIDPTAAISITSPSTAINNVFPKYTEEEIKKVLKESSNECVTRNVTSELLKGVELSEAIDAKCNIIKPTIAQPAIFLNPSDIANNIQQNNGAKVKEPTDSSKKPKKTLVTLTSVAAAGGAEVKQLKKAGDAVRCGEPILQVGTKTVNSPIGNGKIIEIYAAANVKDGDKLFVVETDQSNPADDILQAIVNVSDSVAADIKRSPKLKEDIGKIESKVWINKIIYSIFKGQYDGFTLFDSVPVQEKETLKTNQLKDILKEFANVILPFANNITLDNTELSLWGNEFHNINQPNAISYADLFLTDPNNSKSLAFKHKDGNTIWSGAIKNIREDLLNKSLEISKLTDVDQLEKASNELMIKEKTALSDIEKAANEVSESIYKIGLKLGYYYRINPGSIDTNFTFSDIDTLLKANLELVKNNFETIYLEYTNIKNEIIKIEKSIDNLPDTLNNIANNNCTLADGSAPTASIINNENINVISWPILKQDQESLPADDVNFRGNPAKNSPPITDLKYWKKYCKIASIVNLLPIYWPIGLLIPTPSGIVKIPLPVIWKPIAVIPTPFCVIVVGLAICGICPAPFVYLINPGWPFPIGIVNPKESYFLTGIRGPSKIDDEIGSRVLDVIPTIDVAPEITKLLPFLKDDLPAFERLTLTNLPYILYLTKWCAAGKKTMGFLEN